MLLFQLGSKLEHVLYLDQVLVRSTVYIVYHVAERLQTNSDESVGTLVMSQLAVLG